MDVISDPTEILEVMRSFFREKRVRQAEFLDEIRVKPGSAWNGHTVMAGGLNIAGARPLGLATAPQTGTCDITLTNSDSRYTRSIGQVRLDDIESITML